MDAASDPLRLLGDETRLRLLRLLAKESLNVSELTAILGVAQSGVSRHLGLLKDAGLVREQRTGTFSWYRLDPTLDDANGPYASLWKWLTHRFETATTATKPTTRALPRCGESARKTSATMATRAKRSSWSPAGAGPPGRARSDY